MTQFTDQKAGSSKGHNLIDAPNQAWWGHANGGQADANANIVGSHLTEVASVGERDGQDS